MKGEAELLSGIPTGSETLLLVEDEETVRRLTRRLLERLGYTVLTAASAEEALLLFPSVANRVALVVTDVVMPGLTGVEMAEVLREAYPSLRFLFISGYTSAELGRAPAEAPHPFLPKPFSLDELAREVRDALEP